MQRLASKANVPIEVLNPPPVLCVGGKCYASSRCSQKKPSENALSPPAAHIFTTDEAATAYALSAERILGGDSLFLDRNPAVVPVFVSQLFQSLEISIKHAGIHSGLFTEAEARSRQMRSGHGISEIADLAVERLCGQPHDPLVQALTYFHTEHNAAEIIHHKYAGYDFSITEWEINCAERRHKLISSFDYSSAGQIVNSDIWPDAEYRPIPPESIGDIETRVICGRLVKPSK